ncbi:MAG: hypothetical protein RMK20_16080, partial [Verrucomicrobiales bacterium]|nr:hypothetical protein [Verrucomicrobiales bacterium]
FYILAMALLCLHLRHGVSSMFQTVGLLGRGWDARMDRFARWAAGVIFVGNCSIPVAVLSGLLK